MEILDLSKDLEYLIIFTLILIIPKVLLRFRIPSGVTALIIGIIFGTLDKSLISNQLFKFLSQVGITSLFLFAGLEVDKSEFNEKKTYLFKYIIKYNFALVLFALAICFILTIEFKYSLLLALGLFTPSAGFILSSLHAYKLDENDESWIKSKAFSKEIMSIALLFLTLQYDRPSLLFITLGVFLIFYFVLPKLILGFIKLISPYAPNTEISFLVVLSLLLGVITKEMGTYYIVGSFMVGLIGNQFKDQIFPEGKEVMFRSLASFFSVFLPFYFFYSGLNVDLYKLNDSVFIYGLSYFIIFIPIRFFLIRFGLLNFSEKAVKNYYQISLSLMPTLVFGLIMANIILNQRPEYATYAYGLVVYTLISSILPALFSSFGRKKTIIF